MTTSSTSSSSLLFPLRVSSSRVDSPLSLLPPTRAPFSNDRQRGLRHRGNLLALRRIRADCLPLEVSKRAQTSLTPTFCPAQSGTCRCLPRWDQDLMWRDLSRRSIYETDSSFSRVFLWSLTKFLFFSSNAQITAIFSSFLDYESEYERWISSKSRVRLFFLLLSSPFCFFDHSLIPHFSCQAITNDFVLLLLRFNVSRTESSRQCASHFIP